MRIRSTEGVGTIVSVRIPLADPGDTADDADGGRAEAA